MVMVSSYLSAIVLVCLPSLAFAIESVQGTPPTTTAITAQENRDQYLPSQMTESVYEKFTCEQQNTWASMWNLTVSDYQRYLWLMGHTRSGLYYHNKNLDPSWILGMNASSEQDLHKYAAIAVKNERERIHKELVFQRKFTELSQTLYPNEKPITWNGSDNLAGFSVVKHPASKSLY
jgi:hypothetical protein